MDLIDKINEFAKELGVDTKVVEIAKSVFNDHNPRLECAYIFANTTDNQISEFQSARELQKSSLADNFLIVNGAEKNGFPGYANWHKDLGQLVNYENIKPVPIDNPSQVNTLSESEAIVRYAMAQNIIGLYAVAALFHQLRASMTVASVALKKYPLLDIFNYPGKELPWDESALHSQGKLKDLRINLLRIELGKIKDYQKKGDILSMQEILDYMGKRKIQSIKQYNL